jgi:ABC-type transporter Mla subunit MlaD
MIIKRILGLIMLLTGFTILALSLAGAYYVGDRLSALSEALRGSLDLASQSLDAARATLATVEGVVGDLGGSLDTAVQATANASRTLSDSRPLIDNVATVTTQEVPEAVEGIQDALPNIIQVAGAVDTALVALSALNIDRTINLPFGGSIPLRFDLGIDYNPSAPFDDTLRGFQTSLDGLPESLRGLEEDLRLTNDNLASLAADLQATSDNLTTINTRVGEIAPLLAQYTALIDQLDAAIVQMEGDLDRQIDLLRIGVPTLLVFLALSQLAPLYLGWELLTGQRGRYVVAPAATSIVVDKPAAVTAVLLDTPHDTAPAPTDETLATDDTRPWTSTDVEDHARS